MQGNLLTHLGVFWVVGQPDAFALGHLALVRHPADHLSPEIVVIHILHATAPAPRGICAHKQHLTGTPRPSSQYRQITGGPAFAFMGGQHLRSRPRAFHGGAPKIAGQIFPDHSVLEFVRIKFREGVTAASRGELEPHLTCGPVAVLVPLIFFRPVVLVLHGNQIPDWMIQKGQLSAAGAGHEHKPAALLVNQPANHIALLRRQFIMLGRSNRVRFTDANVAEKDHVVLRELLARLGKFLNVIKAGAGAQFRMQQEHVHIHARIPHHRVTQIAVFPPGITFHHQYVELLRSDRNLKRLPVVFSGQFLGAAGGPLRQFHGERVVAQCGGFPDDRIKHLAVRRDHHVLAGNRIGAVIEQYSLAIGHIQMALDAERDGNAFAEQTKVRRVHRFQNQILLRLGTAHGEGKHRNLARPQFDRGLLWR